MIILITIRRQPKCNYMTPAISVIVPVYNTSKYLFQCLESILSQSLKDIEVICVDDGSTDKSLEILKEFSNKDSRIQIYCQENKGGGGARNLGISHARGKYLLFLDSDDYFEDLFFETLYSVAERDKSDITICGYKLYDNQTGDIDTHISISELHPPKHSPFKYTDNQRYIFHSVPLVVWNRLYNREFIMKSNLRFQEILHYNDVFFCHISLLLAERISLVNQAFVYYRVNQSNNTQSKTYTQPYDFSLPIKAVREILIELEIFEEVEDSFTHYALDSMLYAEKKLRGHDCYSEIHNYLLTQLFHEYGIDKHSSSYYYNKYKYFEYLVVSSSKAEELEKKNIMCHVKTATKHPVAFIQAITHLMHCTIRLLKMVGLKSCLKSILKYF